MVRILPLLLLLLFTGCVEESEESRIMSAVKDYRHYQETLEEAIRKDAGKEVSLNWAHKRVDENTFEIQATLADKKKKTFKWKLTKNLERSTTKKGDVWMLKANNRAARRLDLTRQTASKKAK